MLTHVFCLFVQSNVWWEQNKEVVEWLEKQQAPDSIVSMNMHAVRKDAVISQVDNVLKVCPIELNAITNIRYSQFAMNFRTVRRRRSTR